MTPLTHLEDMTPPHPAVVVILALLTLAWLTWRVIRRAWAIDRHGQDIADQISEQAAARIKAAVIEHDERNRK